MLTLHIKQPLIHLKNLLAESAAFQTLVGATDETEALGFVHYGGAEDKDGKTTAQAAKPLPRAVIALQDFSSAKSGTWTTDIVLAVRVEAKTDEGDVGKSHSDRYLAWLGKLESIVDQIRELGSDGTRLNIVSFEIAIPPQVIDSDRDGDTGEAWGTQFNIGVQT